MKRRKPPLRFLVLVVGGWAFLRVSVHAPGWWIEEGVANPAAVRIVASDRSIAVAEGPVEPDTALPRGTRVAGRLAPLQVQQAKFRRIANARADAASAVSTTLAGPHATFAPSAPWHEPAPVQAPWVAPSAHSASPRENRWSGSAWMLVRRDRAAGLAPGGTLGGSQAGLRIAYRLNGDTARPLAASARLYAPLRDRRASEASLGLDWRPLARVPVHITAERRQALGARGRSAFALGAHGGVSDLRLPGGVRLDAYGQAGLVGARRRDPYADGAARIGLPVGRLDIGGGLWGGAQPGAARLDAGPSLALRLPEARLRLSAEWRFRIAGDARPGSGPALTIGSDF